MAGYDNVKAVHKTLSGTTADLVKLTQFWDDVEISNRGSGSLTVVFNTETAPTALMDGSEIVEAGVTKLFHNAPFNGNGVVGSTVTPCHTIGIVGSGNGYSVIGANSQD